MSLFNHIKRAFGLGANYDSEDSDIEDFEESEQESASAVARATQNMRHIETQKDETLSADIFDGVIELFNKTQPEFVRECMDTDAQKEYILRNIDNALRDRLEKEVNSAKMRGQLLWEEQMKKLDKEVETLRHEKENLEQKREESKSQRLSAERQKRALIERVHDLETQLLTVEAEKEQYILENRSMLNKLRVASVTSGGASTETVDELERLESELESLRREKTTLQQEAEHFKAVAQAHTPVMENLLKIIEELVAEVNSTSAGDQAEELDKIKSELDSAKRTISGLNKKIDGLNFSKEQDAREITDLKTVITSKDNIIAQLKKEKEIEASENNCIIDDAPEYHISIEPKKEEITKNSSRKTKQKPRISAIDELLESTDWFVAPTLPENEKEPEKDDDFGYKAP
ncbi:MAG: hypothetical protein K2H39_00905, partial [Paramuribaculum sp.]|nr:hypothetical protein [Paramuribaculum sp.]